MADKIYIITTGQYSDYGIVRIFSTRKKAMEYLDTKDNEYRLEVYDIDKPIKREKQMYCISFNLDKKKVHGVRTCDPKYANMIHVRHWCFNQVKTLDIYVESDSRKRALKIASERYGAVIANEVTMYPYLRVGVIRHYEGMLPAYFDFTTGELILFKNQDLSIELPGFIKVKRIDL